MDTQTGIISEAQARQITGGRMPLMPAELERALVALDECIAFEDVKYWEDLADAAAAWAQIHKSDQVFARARKLKYHAYKRFWKIADQLNPVLRKKGTSGVVTGSGPKHFLRSHGMSRWETGVASSIARMSDEKFTALVNLPRPPSPAVAARSTTHRSIWAMINNHLGEFLRVAVKHAAADAVADLGKADIHHVLKRVDSVIDWLEEFRDRLELKAKQSS